MIKLLDQLTIVIPCKNEKNTILKKYKVILGLSRIINKNLKTVKPIKKTLMTI